MSSTEPSRSNGGVGGDAWGVPPCRTVRGSRGSGAPPGPPPVHGGTAARGSGPGPAGALGRLGREADRHGLARSADPDIAGGRVGHIPCHRSDRVRVGTVAYGEPDLRGGRAARGPVESHGPGGAGGQAGRVEGHGTSPPPA